MNAYLICCDATQSNEIIEADTPEEAIAEYSNGYMTCDVDGVPYKAGSMYSTLVAWDESGNDCFGSWLVVADGGGGISEVSPIA